MSYELDQMVEKLTTEVMELTNNERRAWVGRVPMSMNREAVELAVAYTLRAAADRDDLKSLLSATQAPGHREMRGAWQGLLGEDGSVTYVRHGRDRHTVSGADNE